MSVSPTGTTSLIQSKPEKQGQPAPSLEAQDATQTPIAVAPATPPETLGQLSQETETDASRLSGKQQTGQAAGKKPDAEQDELTRNAVSKLNSVMDTLKRDLEFEFDSELDRTIVTVRDSTTQEVVRKLPSEAAIKLAKVLQENQAKQESSIGQLLDVKT